MKKLMICMGMAAALVGCAPKQEEVVEQQPQPKEEFKYLVDEFADLRIMRYQVPDWDQLLPSPRLGPTDAATEKLCLLFG